MPSGAKKRKAAKKKKVNQPTNNPNSSSSAPHSHGDDDVKHYDEKESDGGETGSPASQDHHNSQHPFDDREEEEVEKQEDSSSVQLVVPDRVNLRENPQKIATEEEGIVQIEWDMKSEEEDFKSKDISIKSAKKVHVGGSSSSSSSSSSSDDESHAVEKKTVVVEMGPAVDSVKSVESFSEVVTQVNDNIPIEDTNNGGVDSGKPVHSLAEGPNQVHDGILVGETGNGVVKTDPSFDSVKPVDSLSKVVNQVNDSIPIGETDNGVFETAFVIEPDKVSLVEQVVQVTESALIYNPMDSSVVQSDLQEKEEKKLPTLDGNTVASPVLMDLRSRNEEDEVVSTSEAKATVFLDAEDSANEVHEDTLVLSFNAPNDAKHVKEYESPESSDRQPLVASTPQTVQKTSLKSCCGLFELFTSSDRNSA